MDVIAPDEDPVVDPWTGDLDFEEEPIREDDEVSDVSDPPDGPEPDGGAGHVEIPTPTPLAAAAASKQSFEGYIRCPLAPWSRDDKAIATYTERVAFREQHLAAWD